MAPWRQLAADIFFSVFCFCFCHHVCCHGNITGERVSCCRETFKTDGQRLYDHAVKFARWQHLVVGGRAQDEFWCDWHIVSASLVRDHNVIQLSCKSSQHSAWFWIAVKRQWLLDHPTRTLPTLIGPEIDRSARDVIESLGRDGAAR